MRRRATAVAAIASFVVLLCAGSAVAATFKVTRTNDPVPGDCRPRDCSLREAVLAANARMGADRIVLPNGRRAYRLSRPGTGEDNALNGDLDITTDPLVVIHRGAGRATIDAGGLDERIFESEAPATLTKLVLVGGDAVGSDDSGGAIEAGADLTISRSLLRGNTADKFGGAIYHNIGTLRILRSRLSGNRSLDESGAIEVSGERLVIRRSTLSGNVAEAAGSGAIYSATAVLTRIDRTTFAGNRSPGRGGALYVNNGSVRVTNSTFSGNRATDDDGGAIYSSGTLEITNSTFSGNRASGFGGAIYNDFAATVKLEASTVVRNVANAKEETIGEGGGVFNPPAQEFEVGNSILALNRTGDGAADDCRGEFASLGGNLLTSADGCLGFDGPRDAVRANAGIGRLARNGGPTRTVALMRGSAAIGRAVRALAPPRDQRGVRRDRRPDAGAYERRR